MTALLDHRGREIKAAPARRNAMQNYRPYGLMHGGITNPGTGMGVAGTDKSEGSFYQPTRLHSRHELEILYVQSWAARKFIDIPVDDMFIRWRRWEGASADRMEEIERETKSQSRLARAMKAGRLYGTGLMVMVTREADLTMPLEPDKVRAGDLINLAVFDRYDLTVAERDTDPLSPTYGEAILYRINPRQGYSLTVHESRTLRFDGMTPLGSDGYTIYDRDWGVSEIVPAILAIMQDQSTATGAAHLAHEASIPVIRVDGFREALSGGGTRDPDEPSPEQIGERINQLKSIYRTLMMDAADSFERVAVSWSGLHEIMDRFSKRLAACAGIPMTRFWGQSPIGLNATGESDMVNYAAHVAAMQAQMLTDPLERLDMVLARHAGIGAPADYEWLPLTDMSEVEQAQTAKTRVEAMVAAIHGGIIDEDEARAALDGDPVFGALPGTAPELPEPEPEPETTSNDAPKTNPQF